MPFELERRELESGVLLLHIAGTMTMGIQLNSLEQTIAEASRNQHNRIVLDLSEMSYLDSAAIGVLVGSSSLLKSAGGQLRIASVTDRVRAILKLTGLLQVLAVDDSAQASLAALGAGAGAS